MPAARSLPAKLVYLAVSTLGVSVLAGIGPAMAASAAGHPAAGHPAASPDVPGGIRCEPNPGTVLSSRPTSIATAWIPTNWSSSFLAGPGNITRTLSIASTTTLQLSASFALDESLFFASADETYGVQWSHAVAKTYTTTYNLVVPAGKTAKMQQYHQGDEAGIKQKVEAYAASHVPECYVITETSKSGNYFPLRSRADDTFCYAATVHHRASPQVRYNCVAVWR